MITRTHTTDAVRSVAVYSSCERYRYSLSRVWAQNPRLVTFIMLNPSTADERQNDPTVERCERRARALGFGGFSVTNIFAWRDTHPRNLRKANHPIGPENDATILQSVACSDQTIAAWGTHGAHLGRGQQVASLLGDTGHALHHLGLSKAGHPRHPLYLSYTVMPEIWASPYTV